MQQFDSALPVQVRFYSYDPRRDYRLCRHHYFEIFYLSSGEAQFRIGERTFPMRTGDLILVNSTHYHNIEPAQTFGKSRRAWRTLYFHAGAVPRHGRGQGRSSNIWSRSCSRTKASRTWCPPRPGLLRDLRSDALDRGRDSGAHRAFAPVGEDVSAHDPGHLVNHYSAYSGASSSFERKHQRIERLDPLFRYLDEHYAEPVTLDDAAASCGMSKSHFIHFMKQVTGMSFVAYLNQFRVSKAQALMAGTAKSLAEISYEVGFCDQSYFGQVFRKLLKVRRASTVCSSICDRPSLSERRMIGFFIVRPWMRRRLHC